MSYLPFVRAFSIETSRTESSRTVTLSTQGNAAVIPLLITGIFSIPPEVLRPFFAQGRECSICGDQD